MTWGASSDECHRLHVGIPRRDGRGHAWGGGDRHYCIDCKKYVDGKLRHRLQKWGAQGWEVISCIVVEQLVSNRTEADPDKYRQG